MGDVARALGCADRPAGLDRAALPAGPGRGPLLDPRGRQLHGALRHAAPEGRATGPSPLRALPALALLELEQDRHERAALPPAAAQRPPRQPDSPLPDPAGLPGGP